MKMSNFTVFDYCNISLTTITLTIIVTYLYYKHCFNYWSNRGVPSLKPNFPFGNIFSVIIGKKSLYVLLAEAYNEAKAKNYRHLGLYYFNGPVYLPVDPKIIKSILVTNFNKFSDRGAHVDGKRYPLTLNLLSMPKHQWKNARAKIVPFFSSGKLKGMYDTFKKHAEIVLGVIDPLADGKMNVNVKDILRCFSTDIIASTALGLESNTLTQPHSEFAHMTSKIFVSSRWRVFLTIIQDGLQKPGNILKVVSRNRDIEYYFTNVIKTNMEYRKKNNVQRKDLFNILLDQRTSDNITFTELLGESWLFFTAGFETVATTLTITLHELAHNQKLQDEARKEIVEKVGREPTKYDLNDIKELPLLDRIIKESLRKYPAAPIVYRESTEKYQIPGTDIELEKGTPVVISLTALHRRPDFYPDPEKFDPSRFDDDHHIQPETYMPFGDGPRICVGLRFAVLEIKLALAALLANYRFLPSPDTPYELEEDPKSFNVTFSNKIPVYTKIEKLTEN